MWDTEELKRLSMLTSKSTALLEILSSSSVLLRREIKDNKNQCKNKMILGASGSGPSGIQQYFFFFHSYWYCLFNVYNVI